MTEKLVNRDKRIFPAVHIPMFAKSTCYLLTQQYVEYKEQLGSTWLTRNENGKFKTFSGSNYVNYINQDIYECLLKFNIAPYIDEPMDVSESPTLDLDLTNALFKAVIYGVITMPNVMVSEHSLPFDEIKAVSKNVKILPLDKDLKEKIGRAYKKYLLDVEQAKNSTTQLNDTEGAKDQQKLSNTSVNSGTQDDGEKVLEKSGNAAASAAPSLRLKQLGKNLKYIPFLRSSTGRKISVKSK